MANEQQLKDLRSRRKATVTRFANRLERLVAEENKDKVLEEMDKLFQAFSEFESVHDKYHALLEDDQQVDVSDDYFFTVQKNYIGVIKSAKAWLQTVSSVQPPEQVQVADAMIAGQAPLKPSDIAAMINLPKIELEVFDGNPAKYHSFIAMFEEVVDRVISDGKIKLTRLIQYTSGRAREAIRHCTLLDGAVGYNQARDVLARRFGNKHLITDHIITKLRSGKSVRTPEELQVFADELENCRSTLAQNGELQEVDSQTCMIEVVNRLQSHIQYRWKRHAMELKRGSEKYPGFEELVKFVSKEAEEANDPVYSKIGRKQPEVKSATKSGVPNVKSPVSFTSNVSVLKKWERPPCVVCNNDHKLVYCPLFKEMKPIDRLKVVHDHKLCENCLLANHITANCRREYVCRVPGCGRKHSTYIHVKPNSENQSRGSLSNQITSANTTAGDAVYLPVVSVKINDSVNTCALLDTASSSSFCSQDLITKLGIVGCDTDLCLNTINKSGNITTKMVDLKVSSLDGRDTLYLSNVLVVDRIPFIAHSGRSLEQYPHLSDVPIAHANNADVMLLIGQDNSEALVPLNVKKGMRHEPFAVKTLFGWSLNGPAYAQQSTSRNVVSHFISTKTLEDKVHDLWKIENESSDEYSWSKNDKLVVDLWNRNCRKIDGHYELPIPWKHTFAVPNNLPLAKARLTSLKRNLDSKGLMLLYDAEIQKLLEKCYAIPVPVEEIEVSDKFIWYLPHHAVLSDKKPGKVRIVFDCAAKYQGESLNDKCFQGPDICNKLLSVMLRFREYPYAVTSDVEAMYYQVLIPVEHQDALRFLWYKANGDICHYKMTRHVFGGVWCSSSSAYALMKTLEDVEITLDPQVENTIRNSFYVDDCLSSFASREDALRVTAGVRSVLAGGGFNLTKFVSNDQVIQETFNPGNNLDKADVIAQDNLTKALGIQWDVNDDVFLYDLSLKYDSPVTRRSILSSISSIYDPLGLISPFTICGKMIFQDVTRLKLAWDDQVTPNIKSQWNAWQLDLHNLNNFKIARCICPEAFLDSACELHHFCDASLKAYGCCSYLRSINKAGLVNVSLVYSKSKVAPIKDITIPRLELQAAVLAAETDAMLKRQLSIDLHDSYFWTDSEIVLKYLNNENTRFQIFVGNRVSKILELSQASQWHHVKGKDNPADMLSRGKSTEYVNWRHWCHGPAFLTNYKSHWQASQIDLQLSSDDPEVKISGNMPNKFTYLTTVEEHPLDKLQAHYSSWYRLKRAVAWLLRLRNQLRFRINSVKENRLSVAEIKTAELCILRHVQSQSYNDELHKLIDGKSISRNSKIRQLDPFLDGDGVMRVGGRLKRSSLPEDSKHPYLIPHGHPVSVLIVREYHDRAHCGTEWVVSDLRKRFWITKVRKIVKQVAHRCITCKRLFAPTEFQKMSDLPAERLEVGKAPFSYVGLDVFGPFLVKLGRARVKRYGCIFTCLNTRAVHIEKLDGLDTDSFLNGFRRFTSRRGTPVKVFSDNGTNFVGGYNELSRGLKELDEAVLYRYATKLNIEWYFNPPSASHMGGIWERMIRSIRKVFAAISNSHVSLFDDTFHTFLCEVESILNSRPITKVSSDVNDPRPLTPNHLLLLRECPSISPGSFSDTDLYKRRWRCVQQMANEFWHRWLKEYLPNLQRRIKWTEVTYNLKIGDLVLIAGENTPRGVWPMGLVTEIYPGMDGNVRSVKVKTKATELIRPVTKLVLLESSLVK